MPLPRNTRGHGPVLDGSRIRCPLSRSLQSWAGVLPQAGSGRIRATWESEATPSLRAWQHSERGWTRPVGSTTSPNNILYIQIVMIRRRASLRRRAGMPVPKRRRRTGSGSDGRRAHRRRVLARWKGTQSASGGHEPPALAIRLIAPRCRAEGAPAKPSSTDGGTCGCRAAAVAPPEARARRRRRRPNAGRNRTPAPTARPPRR